MSVWDASASVLPRVGFAVGVGLRRRKLAPSTARFKVTADSTGEEAGMGGAEYPPVRRGLASHTHSSWSSSWEEEEHRWLSGLSLNRICGGERVWECNIECKYIPHRCPLWGGLLGGDGPCR